MKQPCSDRAEESNARASADPQEWAKWLTEEYETKRRAHGQDRLETVTRVLDENAGISMNILPTELFEAFSSSTRPACCDHYGVSLFLFVEHFL